MRSTDVICDSNSEVDLTSLYLKIFLTYLDNTFSFHKKSLSKIYPIKEYVAYESFKINFKQFNTWKNQIVLNLK